jgi:hypothetical protein
VPFEHPLPFKPPPIERSGGCPKYVSRHLVVQTVLCERQNGPVDKSSRTGENDCPDESRTGEMAQSPAENIERVLVGILTPLTERLELMMEGLERWLERRSTRESGSGSSGSEGFVPDLAPGMLTGELLESPTPPVGEERTQYP